MRIKSLELGVPEKEPFQKDLLNRKEQAEILTSLVATIEGPCVLAVDAEWGMGKTTFLRMWSQHIRNIDFPTIEFNAWETDFSNDPLLAVSTELIIGLRKYIKTSKLQHLVRLSETVLKQAVPTGIRVLTNALSGGVLNIEPPNLRRELSSYERAKDSIIQLKDCLQEVADIVSETTNHPLIMMIDELDRCRPSYAIELLEITKHLFSIDNIIFVLAINRSEIEHSIKILYGNGFDSQKYLQRFIDIDYKLTEPSRLEFIDALISEINLMNYLDHTQHREDNQELTYSINLLKYFFGTSDTSLRMIEQAIFRFGLLYDSLRYDRLPYTMGAVVALILRTIEPKKYHQFIRKDITEIDVYNSIIAPLFDHPGREFFKLRRDNRSGAGTHFKATIVLASMTKESDGLLIPRMKEDSLLWQKYHELATTEPEDPSDNSTYMSESKLAQDVLNTIASNVDRAHRIVDFGFWHSVKRLELISTDLVKGP